MIDPFRDLPPESKAVFDLVSFTALLGSLMDLLPGVAALLTILWTAIRIVETETVRGFFKKKDEPHDN